MGEGLSLAQVCGQVVCRLNFHTPVTENSLPLNQASPRWDCRGSEVELTSGFGGLQPRLWSLSRCRPPFSTSTTPPPSPVPSRTCSPLLPHIQTIFNEKPKPLLPGVTCSGRRPWLLKGMQRERKGDDSSRPWGSGPLRLPAPSALSGNPSRAGVRLRSSSQGPCGETSHASPMPRKQKVLGC